MNQDRDERQIPLGALWSAAAAVAGLGAWVLFDAEPGLNWFFWVTTATLGLLAFARWRGRDLRPLWMVALAPIAIAGALLVNSTLRGLSLMAILFYLATLMLLAGGEPLRSVTPVFAAFAPLRAFLTAAAESLRRTTAATQLIRSSRTQAWVRGLLLTVPVLVVLALLLAGADPTFARWRDAATSIFDNWDFLPRVIFFLLLLVVVLGTYSHTLSGAERPVPWASIARWLGATERRILLAGVAGLLWLFLLVQLSYLFGNLPQLPASGVTFAEHARRGFAELTVVASLTALILIGSELVSAPEEHPRIVRFLSLAIIAAVFLLLGSALRRVMLYEEAYGFTTARLYAKVYMSAVAIGLLLLAREVSSGFDLGRLFRRSAVVATVLFVGLSYWNHEAWIARRNLDRHASTGKLDVHYLASLTMDALPALMQRLPSLPEPVGSELRVALQKQYAMSSLRQPRRWFEWNRGRNSAKSALQLLDAQVAPLS